VTTLPQISFGEDVRKPALLQRRDTREVLFGIRDGAWQETVASVRSLPNDSQEQNAAKARLPYCTWAGVFSYRANANLVRHSGQCGIDLDGLGDAGAVEVIQKAVADAHCLAAYRSTRGEGVRLIFRIPPCSPESHTAAFEQVASHVQRIYAREADPSGKDVSRASFVSFDRGLWFNPSAEALPIELRDDTQRYSTVNYRCVSSPYAGDLALTCWNWWGRHFANTTPRDNGTAKTHFPLLDLGLAIALHAHRIKEPVTPRIVDTALDAWISEHARQGVRLRCSRDEYRRELLVSVRGAERKPWFKSAADKWLRWTRHKEFPNGGLPHEKILFAIRQHCADVSSDEFFLGARDAGLVAGISFKTAARALSKLVNDGQLKKVDIKRPARHAQTYRLLKATAKIH
jgi:hypothetical protein